MHHHCPAFVLMMAGTILFGGTSTVAAQHEQWPIPVETPATTHWEIPLPGIPAVSSQTELIPGNPWQYDDVYSAVNSAVASNEPSEGDYGEVSHPPPEFGVWDSTCSHLGDIAHRSWSDAKDFYAPPNLICVGVVVLAAAPLANSPADQSLRDWYQRQAGRGQSPQADRFFDVAKEFGEWQLTIPALLAMSIAGRLLPEDHFLSPLSEFGDRSLRALAIGAPMVGLLQYGLGGRRPDEHESYWHPFQDNNSASGHAFVGAIPFLAAASMTESYAIKALFITGSLWTGWSRIHDDDHYFSQVLIGWSMAYLATQSVNRTEASGFHIVPIAISNGVGLGVDLRY